MLKDLLKQNRSYRGYDESYSFTREQTKKCLMLLMVTKIIASVSRHRTAPSCVVGSSTVVRVLPLWYAMVVMP